MEGIAANYPVLTGNIPQIGACSRYLGRGSCNLNMYLTLLKINYLVDEAVNTGKGANSIISMVHHFLAMHSLGKVNLHLHADNCSGQNKNRYVMQYLAWRVLSGLNKSFTLCFLIIGHTKFSPDLCFGLFKQAYRRTEIRCLDDIIRVVEKSAEANQDGRVLVPMYDWAAFFDHTFRQRALKGIKNMHHLRFTDDHPGYVYVKDSVDSPERIIKLLQDEKWKPQPHNLPPVIPPPGVSLERQQYLFENIREFCQGTVGI